MISFELNAQARSELGTGASRRLRHAGMVPGIVYGGGKDPVSFAVSETDLLKSLEHEAFFSHVLNLKLDGAEEQVVLRDLQRHPYKRSVLHLDLQRVSADRMLEMKVPLHFLGMDTAPGVKLGGECSTYMTEIEVRCLAKDLPEYLEVDLSGLNIGDQIGLGDIPLPAGVELVALIRGEAGDQPVAGVHTARAGVEAEEGEEGEAEAGGGE
jgi:large subunit ribosomal protein L25